MSDLQTNELRHAILSKHSTNHLESSENFETLVRQHEDSLHPEGGVQQGIIEEMVIDYWRMRRFSAIENGMMNQALDGTSPDADKMTRLIDAQSSLTDNHRYNLLNLYEDRCHRRYYRALNCMLAISRRQDKKEK
jgi:hypothetical protein